MTRQRFRTALPSEEFEESGHRERWILSYADFITLMFAFFVVMYSISSVNDGKFRVLSQTMADVFQNPEVAVAVEQRLVERARQQLSSGGALLAEEDALFSEELANPALLRPQELGEVLLTLLTKPISENRVRLRTSEDWTEVEIDSDLAFNAATTRLTPEAVEALAAIAELARVVDMPVRVEGFTDNLPVSDTLYASNRERSAATAARIADALVKAGVSVERVSATGFGEAFPIASNASADGRRRNRRVVVAVARHNRVPEAGASLAARTERQERLSSRILERVVQLPGPEPITL